MTSVVLAHDYLTQFGGAERVALSMTRAFPGAPLLTSFYEPSQTFPAFADVAVEASSHNRITPLRTDPRRALPLLPRLWDHLPVPATDVVLCSSSGWSHGLRTDAPKVVYCHNPPRWLHQVDDYQLDMGRGTRAALKLLDPSLRRWDRRAALSAHTYLANSGAVAQRIHDVYGIDAEVLHPPVLIDAEGPQEQVPGSPDDYFLVVGRSRGYKNAHAACEAFAQLPHLDLVVVGSALEAGWPSNIHAVPHATDAQLRHLYAGARALVATAHEDFGLAVVEAAAFGTPSIALAAGGYLETVVEGVSGRFVPDQTSDAIRRGVLAEVADPTDRWTTVNHAKQFSEYVFHRRLRAVIDSTR